MQARLVVRRDGRVADVASARDQKSVRSVNCVTKYVLVCCLAIGHLVVHIPQLAIICSSHQSLEKSFQNIAVAVPSFTRGTVLCASPLGSERWELFVSCPLYILTRFNELPLNRLCGLLLCFWGRRQKPLYRAGGDNYNINSVRVPS